MGVDGISMPMVFLTLTVSLVSIAYSWIINERVKDARALPAAPDGLRWRFRGPDFFLFYIFWEIGSLVPLYFIIGAWGGPNRGPAIKFFLYTLVGSVLVLLAIVILYFASGVTPADRTASTSSR